MDNNIENIWLDIDDVAVLTEELKETVRRKCKRGEYISTFTKKESLKYIKLNCLHFLCSFKTNI